jgi:hypothetical protein
MYLGQRLRHLPWLLPQVLILAAQVERIADGWAAGVGAALSGWLAELAQGSHSDGLRFLLVAVFVLIGEESVFVIVQLARLVVVVAVVAAACPLGFLVNGALGHHVGWSELAALLPGCPQGPPRRAKMITRQRLFVLGLDNLRGGSIAVKRPAVSRDCDAADHNDHLASP